MDCVPAFAVLLLIAASLVQVYRKNRKVEASEDGQQYVRIMDVFNGLPFSLIPFLLSMFIAVLTLDKYGITNAFSYKLFSFIHNALDAGLLFGFVSALCSNVINNIPMSILFTSVLNDGGLSLYSPLAIYSAIIGSNIGAFFSPIGALAGVMLMKILKDKGAGLSALSFIRYCAPVATVSLVVSVLVLIPIL